MAVHENPNLKKHFQNPPKGGNETGVPTLNSMSPLPKGGTAPSLRGALGAGQNSASTNRQESYRSGQPEFRNVRRGDLSGQGEHSGYIDEEADSMAGTDQNLKRPKPDVNPNPDTIGDVDRSDGKRQYSMGRPNGNPSAAKRTPRTRRGPFD